MEAQALIKAIATLLVDIDRVRLNIVSRGAKIEEFNHKTRNAAKLDQYAEMAAQAIRKDMRENLKEVEDLATKFESLHVGIGVKSDKLSHEAARLLAGARSLAHTLTNLTGTALQVHNTLRSSRFGVLGWNIHHDAQESEEFGNRMVKICQRVASATQVDSTAGGASEKPKEEAPLESAPPDESTNPPKTE